jgi:hypothetical protein
MPTDKCLFRRSGFVKHVKGKTRELVGKVKSVF